MRTFGLPTAPDLCSARETRSGALIVAGVSTIAPPKGSRGDAGIARIGHHRRRHDQDDSQGRA